MSNPRRIALDFDPALASFLLDLRDRGDLSRQSILEEVDYDEADEARKREYEKDNYDDAFAPTRHVASGFVIKTTFRASRIPGRRYDQRASWITKRQTPKEIVMATAAGSRSVVRPCRVCGAPFSGRGRRYCSLRCRMDAYAAQRREQRQRARPATGVCRQCGNIFDQPPPGQKGQLLYCSKRCRTRWHRAKAFPRRHLLLSADEYDALLAAQGGVCRVCGRPERSTTASGKLFRLAVDHDHDTNVVRGLLCSRCNIGLGSFEHDAFRLVAAALYLAEHLPAAEREDLYCLIAAIAADY